MRWWILGCVVAVVALRAGSCDPKPARLRVATFNIEDFPKHARQADRVFDEIAGLDAGIVAVQEIIDHELFATTARARLGSTWSFVHVDTAPLAAPRPHRSHHLGVLFDRARFSLVSVAVHDETRLVGGRHKPTLEVRLQPASGPIVRVLVVHLKAGGEGRPIRTRQLKALAEIARTAQQSGDRVILLGDFNATDEGDRVDIASLVARADLKWTTERLACSAFWSRDDGCPRSRLDHVASSTRARAVTAAGACATEGCEWQDRCPLYTEQVSDHCPIVVEY
jgi:endonuclease/exonuclease/phosphatase family metal-dependent hydrolase